MVMWGDKCRNETGQCRRYAMRESGMSECKEGCACTKRGAKMVSNFVYKTMESKSNQDSGTSGLGN